MPLVLPVPAAWKSYGFGFVGSMNVGKSGQLNYQAYVVNGAILDFSVDSASNPRRGRRAQAGG